MAEPLHDVFISHSSTDKLIAEAISHHFESLGVRSFLAQERIPTGAQWRAALAQAIKASRAIVLVVSKHSNASKNVREEINVACEEGLPIVPFKLEKVELHPELVLPLAGKHWLDAINPPLAAHIQKLGADVCQMLGIPVRPPFGDPPPGSIPPPRPPGSRARSPRTLVAVGAVLMALLAGGWALWRSNRPAAGDGTKTLVTPLTPPPILPVPAPKLELLQADGKTPLEGTTVKAGRGGSFSVNGLLFENGIKFAYAAKLAEGKVPANSWVQLQYKAVSALEHRPPQAGTISVDSAFVWAEGKPWMPVTQLPSADPYSHCYEFLDGPHDTVGISSVRAGWLYVGTQGFIPPERIPVRLVYYLPAQRSGNRYIGDPIAKADFFVEAAPVWSLGAEDTKLQLMNPEGTAPIESGKVPAGRLAMPPGGGVVMLNGTPAFEGPAIRITHRTKTLEKNFKGPVSMDYYLLHARFSDEASPTDGRELVADPSTGWKKVRMFDGNYIEIPGPRYILAETIFPEPVLCDLAPTTLSLGPKGLIPAGEHEVGVVLRRAGEILYRSKLTVVVPEE